MSTQRNADANYLESHARGAAITQSEFLHRMYGNNIDLLLRGFLAGFADALTERKGSRYAFEYLSIIADQIIAEANKTERAA